MGYSPQMHPYAVARSWGKLARPIVEVACEVIKIVNEVMLHLGCFFDNLT